MDNLDALKKWAERFWIIRGIATAFLLLALVPEFTSLEKYEFLRGFHATIIGWNYVAGAIGDAIGKLPILPHLESSTVNTILFAISFGLPSALVAHLHTNVVLEQTMPEAERLLERGLSRLKWLKSNWLIKGYRSLFKAAYLEQMSWTANGLRALLVLAIPAFFYWQLANGFPFLYSDLDGTQSFQFWLRLVSAAIIFLCFVALFIVALLTFRGIAKGIIIALTFVLTLEILYFLNTPVVARSIDTFADKALGPDDTISAQEENASP